MLRGQDRTGLSWASNDAPLKDLSNTRALKHLTPLATDYWAASHSFVEPGHSCFHSKFEKIVSVSEFLAGRMQCVPIARKNENWSQGPTVDEFCAGTYPPIIQRGPPNDLRLAWEARTGSWLMWTCGDIFAAVRLWRGCLLTTGRLSCRHPIVVCAGRDWKVVVAGRSVTWRAPGEALPSECWFSAV